MAGVALSSSVVITVSVMILGYLIVTHSLAPRRLKYSMPLNLNLEGSDLVSNISLYSLEEYLEDRQVRDVFLLDHSGELGNQKPLLSSGQVIDVWLELKIPPEYERIHPERKYAHITSTLSTYGGRVVGRTSKPIFLNGRPKSALNLVLIPWRWLGIFKRYHTVIFPLYSGFQEKNSGPSVFLATEIKARSAPGPEILDVSIHVAIRAGIIKNILFYARPQSFIGRMLGYGSLLAIFGAVGIILWCIQTYHQFVPSNGEDISENLSEFANTPDSQDAQKSSEFSMEDSIMEERQSDSGELRKRRIS